VKPGIGTQELTRLHAVSDGSQVRN
jgi:hypothetical protein